MNKVWIKRVTALFVFLAALFVTDMVLNSSNSEITMDMPKAVLPVVSVESGGYEINTMYGYTSKRKEAYTRDNILPVDEDREITLVVEDYQTDIESVAYEVRSLDGERLIEGSEIPVLQKMTDRIKCSIHLKDLIEENREYRFVAIVTLKDGEKVYYYTRFIQNGEYYEKEKLDFILSFHNITLGQTDGSEIKKYLESNSKGDNTTFHKVNINSSLEQVMWGTLSVEEIQEPLILLKDITKDTASVVLQYLVREKGVSREKYYFAEEYYRVRYTPERMYLLDYERTMDEIFDGDKKSFSNDKICLGICDENVEMMESEGGKNLAFVNADRLFVYNSTDNRLSEVFSFYNEHNFDIRTRNRNFDIKILKMEDSGNMSFMTAGYINRGIHEGKVGIIVYDYDIMRNTIEEQIFIPYEKSPDILQQEVDQFVYLNKENHLYLILEGSLYDIDLEEKNCEIINENLTENNYKASKSGRMISWMKNNKEFECETLVWLNLSDGSRIEVNAGTQEWITGMGFMEEDLIYGLAKKADTQTMINGDTLFPVYKVMIINQDEKVLKAYEKENCYVTGCSIADNQLTLNRIEKDDTGNYHKIEDDHIASSDIQDDNINKINTVVSDVYKKTVQIVLKNTTDPSNLKVQSAKEVIFEGGRSVNIDLQQQERYFVYGARGIEKITSFAAHAVACANEISGSVTDEKGNYIWKKGTMYTKNQIMSITGRQREGQNSSLAVCLDTILELEGISGNTQSLLDMGESAFQILDSLLHEKKVLNLTGCPLDAILYYPDQDIPVLAIMENGDACLITGFNEYNVVVMDPKTGNVTKKGMNDARELFEKNGNQFITYIR